MRLRLGQPPALLILFLAFFVCALPRTAHAEFDGDACLEAYTQANTAEYQANIEAGIKVFQDAGQPDIKQVYCWDQITAAFEMIISVADPLSIVRGVLNSIISSMLNQLCTAALNAVNQITGSMSFLAQMCIPMPGLTGFNFSTGSFGIQGQACNGIPLITVGASAGLSNSGGTMSAPNLWKIFGQ